MPNIEPSDKMRPVNNNIASMTGYARLCGQLDSGEFQIDIKSVNSRGLDIRIRLTPGLEQLEQKIRETSANILRRGSININITFKRNKSSSDVMINEQALGTVLDALDALSGRIEADRPRLDGILALKGVLEISETPLSEEAQEILFAQLFEKFELCLSDLVSSRRLEGEKLKLVLIKQIEEIDRLIDLANNHPARKREVILERLEKQLSDLIELNPDFSRDRLHQEAMILATKADIREELDRLKAHTKTARQMIDNGGAVGRKLDFLSQEFNREANTICSKSNDSGLTSIGLDLKVVIDQFREQVQNIE